MVSLTVAKYLNSYIISIKYHDGSPNIEQQECNFDLWRRQNEFIYFHCQLLNFNDFQNNAHYVWEKSSSQRPQQQDAQLWPSQPGNKIS